MLSPSQWNALILPVECSHPHLSPTIAHLPLTLPVECSYPHSSPTIPHPPSEMLSSSHRNAPTPTVPNLPLIHPMECSHPHLSPTMPHPTSGILLPPLKPHNISLTPHPPNGMLPPPLKPHFYHQITSNKLSLSPASLTSQADFLTLISLLLTPPF